MFTAGLLEEVRQLLAKGISSDLPAMSAIGYRECTLVLRGDLSMEAAKIRMRKLTRIFVRRQANWFKLNDPEIHWFDAGQTRLEEIISMIHTFIEN
jgi:tRNA dimethylallyltransferase